MVNQLSWSLHTPECSLGFKTRDAHLFPIYLEILLLHSSTGQGISCLFLEGSKIMVVLLLYYYLIKRDGHFILLLISKRMVISFYNVWFRDICGALNSLVVGGKKWQLFKWYFCAFPRLNRIWCSWLSFWEMKKVWIGSCRIRFLSKMGASEFKNLKHKGHY